MERARPEWIPDERASQCAICLGEFGLLRSKHHCRACGHVVCEPCSSKTLPLPQYKFEEAVRVCNPCFVFERQRGEWMQQYFDTFARGEKFVLHDKVGGKRTVTVSLSLNGLNLLWSGGGSAAVKDIVGVRTGVMANFIPNSGGCACFGSSEPLEPTCCITIGYGRQSELNIEAPNEERALFWTTGLLKGKPLLIEKHERTPRERDQALQSDYDRTRALEEQQSARQREKEERQRLVGDMRSKYGVKK
eukprot:TRINITY_DN17664_c0_g1_i1.p1 TRINITY_DN17664_c0_g1~~TRINITY_DN17664_c0_g1_i1.p1  ORF type:complete len:248 (+),score=37.70 TRINITY_DN17664_c0_g1_i1:22-765(+)